MIWYDAWYDMWYDIWYDIIQYNIIYVLYGMTYIYQFCLFTLHQISPDPKMRIDIETCVQHKVLLKYHSFYCVNITLNSSNTHRSAANVITYHIVLFWILGSNFLIYRVEVSVTGWSLVQRSPTERGVSECDHESSIMRRP